MNKRRKSIFNSVVTVFFVLAAAFMLTGCGLRISSGDDFSNLPKVPENYDKSQMAQIKLIVVNVNGFNDMFGSESSSTIFWIPISWHDRAGFTFGSSYKVASKENWETFKDGKGQFNDKAVFSIPANEWEVCATKLVFDKTLKYCYEKFKFEPGQKYELYMYYREDRTESYRSTHYKWYLKIVDIVKVDEFGPEPKIKKKYR